MTICQYLSKMIGPKRKAAGSPSRFIGLSSREQLAACDIRMILIGHLPVEAEVKAQHEICTHLVNDSAPADLESKTAPVRDMEKLVIDGGYNQGLRKHMHCRIVRVRQNKSELSLGKAFVSVDTIKMA